MPYANGAVVKLQAPLAFTVVVPSDVVPSYTVTVLLASAVPVRVTELFALTVSFAITGAAGGVVSICGLP